MWILYLSERFEILLNIYEYNLLRSICEYIGFWNVHLEKNILSLYSNVIFDIETCVKNYQL